MNVTWETPPDRLRGGGSGKPAEVSLAAALKDNPGQWARMADFRGDDQIKAGQLATLIRSGKRAAFRADRRVDGGEFEAVSRKDRENKNVTAVYVRFVTQVTD